MGVARINVKRGMNLFSRIQTWFSMLQSDPLGLLLYLLYLVVTVLLSLILHEVAHGYVAYRCGDPTAKWMGRLSLDPRKHLDPIGTVCMFLFGIGWAKPVPVNPRNFQHYRRDDFKVSIAGIVTNLSLFLLCTALSVGVNAVMYQPEFLRAFKDSWGTLEPLISPYYMLGYSVAYGDVSAELLSVMAHPWLQYVQRFLLNMATINLSLAVFNFLPIPPLDGYHIFNDLIFKGRFQLSSQAFRIAQLVLLVLCFSGLLSELLYFINTNVFSAVTHLFLLMTGGA